MKMTFIIPLVLLYIVSITSFGQRTQNHFVHFSNIDGFSGYVKFTTKYTGFATQLSADNVTMVLTKYNASQEELKVLLKAGYDLRGLPESGVTPNEDYGYEVLGNAYASTYEAPTPKLHINRKLGAKMVTPDFSTEEENKIKKDKLWERSGGFKNEKVVTLYISELKNNIQRILNDNKREKEEQLRQQATKERLEKQQQEQKAAAEQRAQKEARERETKAREQQRSYSDNYSNSTTSSSSYSSTSSNRSSGKTQQQKQQELNVQQQKKAYDNYMERHNTINRSIDKVNQAQQKFDNYMDQQRAQYKAQSEAENARWEQEKLQEQLEEEREEQERIEKERRKEEAKENYNRKHSEEYNRKRNIIKTRERLLSGSEWGLSPTFNLITENGESIFLFFVEVHRDYRDLNDYSDFNYNNPRVSISILSYPEMTISPIIEIKPRNNGEYPFPEDIISKLKKDYPSNNSHRNLYQFHDWTTNKEELEQAYNSFLNHARSTDFAITFHENKVNLQDEHSDYWAKDSATLKNKTINYWDKNADRKKTTTQSKDYWGEPAKKPAKKEAKKPDYWN